MKIEGTGLDGLTAELSRLDDIMEEHGLIRAGQWDYERVTFDRKYEIKDEVFYLRVLGYAIAGDVGGKYAEIKLLTPLLGKHYYPHGVEYGDGEDFPAQLVKNCKSLLEQVRKEIEKLQ